MASIVFAYMPPPPTRTEISGAIGSRRISGTIATSRPAGTVGTDRPWKGES